jgi:1-deoxy-D-xylulose 5-phosphate reductoisomerase
MNAANEECVSAFILNQIQFTRITEIVEKVVNLFLDNSKNTETSKLSIDDIFRIDLEARNKTKELILL